ncbi:MAG: hypothetical protein AVDCRST_MAG71-842, partial [uncultured Lysobacter sp.]
DSGAHPEPSCLPHPGRHALARSGRQPRVLRPPDRAAAWHH